MKKQEKQDREEKQKELMEKLEEGIKAVFTSERYTEYLKLMNYINHEDPQAFITVYNVSDMRYQPKV